MSIANQIWIVVAALALEAAAGYPSRVYDVIGHPVSWIGRLISGLDRLLNRPAWRSGVRRAFGVAALLVLIAVPLAIAVALQSALSTSVGGQALLAVLMATLIASRSLFDHVKVVASGLETGGLAAGREAVGKIVGRDPEVLDEPGVARAAIESLAENASDGVVAPVFWALIGGLPGIVAYKAINTADSMIGHKNEKYGAFGWAAARLDDLVNLPASRLTGGLFALAAMCLPEASPGSAIAAMCRDAKGHRSPNAGWPESAMAGALGLKLNGPRQYGGVMTNDAYMGDGRRDANVNDIRRALQLSLIAWLMMTSGLIVVAIIARS